jgi:polyhydroxyalkanoate synthesis regulator phasin
MPAPRSSSAGGSSASGGRKPPAKRAAPKAKPKARTAAAAKSGAKQPAVPAKAPATKTARASASGAGDGIAGLAEQLANRVIKPLDLVMLTRERIQETLDEAAARGRVTRGDANDLVSELVKRGRQQTDDLVADIERLLERGRSQLGAATNSARRSPPVDRVVRNADRARRSVGVGPSFPILGYDELTARQVEARVKGLKPADLRNVRDYERKHANRKSVLAAIEKALA